MLGPLLEEAGDILEIVAAELVHALRAHVPANVHEAIAEPRAVDEAISVLARDDTAFLQHAEGVRVILGDPEPIARDEVIGEVEAAVDGDEARQVLTGAA